MRWFCARALWDASRGYRTSRLRLVVHSSVHSSASRDMDVLGWLGRVLDPVKEETSSRMDGESAGSRGVACPSERNLEKLWSPPRGVRSEADCGRPILSFARCAGFRFGTILCAHGVAVGWARHARGVERARRRTFRAGHTPRRVSDYNQNLITRRPAHPRVYSSPPQSVIPCADVADHRRHGHRIAGHQQRHGPVELVRHVWCARAPFSPPSPLPTRLNALLNALWHSFLCRPVCA